MDPRDFHKLATELCQHGRPADLRCAVGRAYYAAFNVAAEMFRTWSIPVLQNASGHGEVLRYLGNSNDAELQQVGYKLGNLRGRRNAADYDLSAKDVENGRTVLLLVDEARRAIATMDLCLTPARSAPIIAAIEDYRRRVGP